MKPRNIYNARGWVLGQCLNCGGLNYVEPHGTTARCRCSAEWTEHRNIPYAYTDASGMVCVRRPPNPNAENE